MTIADIVLADLERHANPEAAAFAGRFFKTGKGQYGEGDMFIGVKVPRVREVAKRYAQLSIQEIETLLDHPIHEVRLCAVIIMTMQARRADDVQAEQLFSLYLRRTDRVNNWDIVDVSCRDIVGGYLQKHPKQLEVLHKLAVSKNIWERRIAIVSTWQFIRLGQLDPTFTIAGLLLQDKQDLMHKAVGWMLREAGKRDADRLRLFLVTHIHDIPRTTLRYAIERFDPEERHYFLRLGK